MHEHRRGAVLILVGQYERAKRDEKQGQAIFGFYLRALRNGPVNNWDVIDSSAPGSLDNTFWSVLGASERVPRRARRRDAKNQLRYSLERLDEDVRGHYMGLGKKQDGR